MSGVNRWDDIKFKILYTAKETRMRRQNPQNGRKIFATYFSHRELISKIGKKLKKLYTKKQITQLINGQMTKTDTSKEERELAKKYMKKI